MLITARFVVVNLPKTGSTFVRDVIKTIHADRRWWRGERRFCQELLFPNANLLGHAPDQHGRVNQIPQQFRRLPIVAVLRDPYAKLLSAYDFRWWQRHPQLGPAAMAEHFPMFPDLTIDDFVRLRRHLLQLSYPRSDEQRVGPQTVQFIRMFARDPVATLAALSDDHVSNGELRAALAPVHFLRQEHLRDDLTAFLASHGYTEREVAVCHTMAAANVSAPGRTSRDRMWTEAAIAHVRDDERHLLSLLAQLGFRYPEPAKADVAGIPSIQSA